MFKFPPSVNVYRETPWFRNFLESVRDLKQLIHYASASELLFN